MHIRMYIHIHIHIHVHTYIHTFICRYITIHWDKIQKDAMGTTTYRYNNPRKHGLLATIPPDIQVQRDRDRDRSRDRHRDRDRATAHTSRSHTYVAHPPLTLTCTQEKASRTVGKVQAAIEHNKGGFVWGLVSLLVGIRLGAGSAEMPMG